MYRLFLLLIFLSCFNLSWRSFNSPVVNSPITKTQTADCFTINTTALMITANSCGSKDGSVSGLTIDGEGKFSYSWKDAFGTSVGNALNLRNTVAGTYTLEVKGAESCPNQAITVIIDEIKGIDINLTQVKVIAAGCDNKGSVLGIKTTGATRFEWRSLSTQTIVSNTEDLLNMPIGLYIPGFD